MYLGFNINPSQIKMGAGDDIIFVDNNSWGSNHINGGDGFDIIAASGNDARLHIETVEGIEVITGQNNSNFTINLTEGGARVLDLSKTLLINVARISGTTQADEIYMAGAFVGDNANLASNDYILSGAGNDLVHAGFGNDIIDAGTGVDTVFGGHGSDIFVTQAAGQAASSLKIMDFSYIDDVIAIHKNTGIVNFDDVQAKTTYDDGGATINIAPNNIVYLSGVQSGQLTAGEFIFI